jgi:biotin-(acetyl-CoA carboxylase) ligase
MDKPYLIIGCGLNIMHAPEDRICVADIVDAHNIDWASQGGFFKWRDKNIEGRGLENNITLIRDLFFYYLTKVYGQFFVDGFQYIQQEYMKKAAFLGQSIKVRLPQETISGIFEGIDDTGALILTLHSGITRIIQSGEVFFDRA